MLLIWCVSLILNQLTDVESDLLRLVNCILSMVALAVNITALLFDGRTRENLMYARDNILAFVLMTLAIQIFSFLSLHPVFGPWSIIIEELVMDVCKFLVVLMLFIVTFTFHMLVIYKQVYGKAKVDNPTSMTIINYKDGTVLAIFEELLFACFGLASRPEKLNEEELKYSPAATYNIASGVFCLYEIVIAIVMINMLIAMMSNTYTRIEERSNIEWKFGRARTIWNMAESDSVPCPVNLFTTVIRVIKVSLKAKCLCCTVNVPGLFYDMSHKSTLGEGAEELGEEPGEKKAKHINTVVPWREIVDAYWVGLGKDLIEIREEKRKLLSGK